MFRKALQYRSSITQQLANSSRLTCPAAATSILSQGKLFQQKRFSSSTDHDDHKEETYEEYTQRYLDFFNKEADDVFELSRGLNNAFNTDVVPSPEVLTAALKCARKLNSFPIATRVVEALKEKLDGDEKVYQAYLAELKPTLDELGVPTPEELGR